MPQMKLAWIAINGPPKITKAARQRLELILDTYLSVNTPVQAALPELLAIGACLREQIAERTRRNAESLFRLLKDSAAHPLHVEGGWSAIIQLPKTMTEEAWVIRLVKEQGVIVQPGFFFDMHSEPYAVVSLITAPEASRKAFGDFGCLQPKLSISSGGITELISIRKFNHRRSVGVRSQGSGVRGQESGVSDAYREVSG